MTKFRSKKAGEEDIQIMASDKHEAARKLRALRLMGKVEPEEIDLVELAEEKSDG